MSRTPPHGETAPSSIERSGSGTASSASASRWVPSPSHTGHAPYGELNEKFLGASSSNESPQNVHASDCEKLMISSVPSCWTTAIEEMPSASWSAASMESATRRRMSGLATSRSTTTSMVCFLFFSSFGGSASRCSSPSIRTRLNPLWATSASSFSYSPLRPRTTGASTWKRVPSGSSST